MSKENPPSAPVTSGGSKCRWEMALKPLGSTLHILPGPFPVDNGGGDTVRFLKEIVMVPP